MMLLPTILPSPADNPAASKPPAIELLQGNRWRRDDPIGRQGFSSVLDHVTEQRSSASDRSPSIAQRDRSGGSDRTSSPQRSTSKPSSQRPQAAETHREHESQDTKQSSSKANESASVMERPQVKETSHTEEKAKAEKDQPIKNDQPTEEDQPTESQTASMIVAFSVCLVEPAAGKVTTQCSADDGQALAAPVAAQPSQSTLGTIAATPVQQVAAETDSNGPRPPEEAGQGNGNQPQSSGAKTDPLPSGPMPAGESPGQTNRAQAQTAPQAATMLASLSSSNGETVSLDQPARSLSEVPLPGEAPSIRTLRVGTEDRQISNHSVSGLMGENPISSDLSRASQGHGAAMGERDDRAAAGKIEPRGGVQSHGHGESGFGETVAALGGEKPALTDGGTGRMGSSLATGRTGATPEASQGDIRPAVMQSVSLDLEPADLGPVNVRIFMMDRTVHAHIRTEHMDLGQGMLSQQQQLETKLHSSGLEMGEFKVTVDQQQLSRGDSQGWLRQEPEWRPARDEADVRGNQHDARESIGADPRRGIGIVSIFA